MTGAIRGATKTRTIKVEYKRKLPADPAVRARPPRQTFQHRPAQRDREINAGEARDLRPEAIARDLLFRYPLVENAIEHVMRRLRDLTANNLRTDPDGKADPTACPEVQHWLAIYKWLQRHRDQAIKNPQALGRPNRSRWAGSR